MNDQQPLDLQRSRSWEPLPSNKLAKILSKRIDYYTDFSEIKLSTRTWSSIVQALERPLPGNHGREFE